jgi:hypothetical protein
VSIRRAARASGMCAARIAGTHSAIDHSSSDMTSRSR